MEYFDKEGRRIFIYGITNYEYEILIGSYIKITKEQLKHEILEAHKISELYNKEYDLFYYGKPVESTNDEEFNRVLEGEILGTSLTVNEIDELLENKYPLRKRDIFSRLEDKFETWTISPELSENQYCMWSD